MTRGRPRNQDRDNAIALDLPTYIGTVHPACGTAERYVIGGRCIQCARTPGERRAGETRGRAPNKDRQRSIALGLPTYIGKVHPACGTAERFIAGGCVACKSAAKAATAEKRRERAARQSAFKGMGSGCRSTGSKPNEDRLDAIALGLPTYTGRVHAKCGTAEKRTKGGECQHCYRERLAAIRLTPEQHEAKLEAERQAKQAEAAQPIARREFDGPRPTRFFTGVPCKHGHIAERLICSGACITCMNIRDKAKRNTREYKDKRNTLLAARRATKPTPCCVICSTPFVARTFRLTCSDTCAKWYYAKSPQRRSALRAMAGIPDPGYSKKVRTPRRVLVQQRLEREAAIANQEVDFQALVLARELTKEARANSHIVNADAYRARSVRQGQKQRERYAEALAVAEMMIPDTIKSVKGYHNRVKAARDFVKMIGVQHPPEKKHDTVRHPQG